MATHESLPTRGSLLAKIKDLENDAAWDDFYATYGTLVRKLALKAGLTEDEAKDVVQEVFIGVTRNIGEFVYVPGKCSFKHWLSQMVRWRILDQLQKRLPVEPGGPLDQRPEQREREREHEADGAVESALDGLWEAEWRQHLINAATVRLKERVSAKQFQIFFLHVLKEMPVTEVVQRLKVTRTQVYLAKLRVTRLFQKELRALPGQ